MRLQRWMHKVYLVAMQWRLLQLMEWKLLLRKMILLSRHLEPRKLEISRQKYHSVSMALQEKCLLRSKILM